MATIEHFINNVFFPSTAQNKYHQSSFWYKFNISLWGWILFIVCGVELNRFCTNYVIWAIFIIISSYIFMDWLLMMISCIKTDFYVSYEYNYRYESDYYHDLYSYYGEIHAYHRSNYHRDIGCEICKNYFNFRDPNQKQLLFCGHLFHKQCLENYEQYHWNNNIFPNNYSKCPNSKCKAAYYSKLEKYDYDSYFIDNLPWYHQEIWYPGRVLMHNLWWKSVNDCYYKLCDKSLEEFKNEWNTHYFL